MKTYTFDYSCVVCASVQEVCRFHTDPRNLPTITPPWMGITLDSYHLPMKEGNRVTMMIKRLGIPTRWEVELEKLKCPHTIIDRMVSGPFRFFRHERNFSALSERETLICETITLALPLGWVGNMALPFIRREMDTVFAYRHRGIQHHFIPADPTTAVQKENI